MYQSKYRGDEIEQKLDQLDVAQPLSKVISDFDKDLSDQSRKLTELESKALNIVKTTTDERADNVIASIVDCKIWGAEPYRSIGISAFGRFGEEFLVNVSTSDGVYLGKFVIVADGNYPSSGVVNYHGGSFEKNGNFYISLTIDWSKYGGVPIALPNNIFDFVKVGFVGDDSYLLYLNNLSASIMADTEKAVSIVAQTESFHNISEPHLNLLNVDGINCRDNYYLAPNGAEIANDGYKISEFIAVNPNTLYTYGCSYGYLPIGIIYDANKVVIGSFGDVTTSSLFAQFTTPNNAAYVRWTLEKARSHWFINEGEKSFYSEYESVLSPSKVKKPMTSYVIDEFNKKENLFNKSTITMDTYVDGVGDISALLGQGYNSSDWIEVEPNKTYTIFTGYNALENSAMYNAARQKISTFSEYTTAWFKTITTSEDARYIRLTVKSNQLDILMVYEGNEQKKAYPHEALVALANMSLPKSLIVVSKDGRGDYKTIGEAIAAANSHTPNNEVDIIILEGEYKETIDIRYNWINLIGINREKCIIYHDNGNYGTHFPINMGGHNMLRNLTIKSLAPTDESTITSGMAYAIHFDVNGEGVSVLENCTLESELNSAFGVGLHSNQTLICRNCEFKGLRDIAGSAIVNAGLLFHNVQGNNGVNQRAIFENCTFYSKKWVGITLSDVSDGITDCVMDFRNCIVASDSASWDGKIETNPAPIDASCICGNMKKGVTSYNNNISALNKTVM